MIATMPHPNVIQFAFPNRRELTMTMCRPQEFYESAHAEIRGKKFDWEKFLEVFSDIDGRFEYFSFWSGFNFPGRSFEDFLKTFGEDLSRRERHLAKEVFSKVDRTLPYYIIATLPDATTTIRHEMAHALFCVDQGYKEKSEEMVNLVPMEERGKIESGLSKMGYTKEVHVDEIQAYLSTATPEELKKRFDLCAEKSDQLVPPFREMLASVLGPLPSQT